MRPLSRAESKQMAEAFTGKHAVRNRTLLTLGVNTGLRVSELLSINIGDVLQHGRIVDAVSIRRAATKGKEAGRVIKLNSASKAALQEYLPTLAGLGPDVPLFHSQYRGVKRLDRTYVWKLIRGVAAVLGITGNLGTHCLRKTFADRMYDLLGKDLVRLQVALGHKWITSTTAYVSFRQDDIDRALEGL